MFSNSVPVCLLVPAPGIAIPRWASKAPKAAVLCLPFLHTLQSSSPPGLASAAGGIAVAARSSSRALGTQLGDKPEGITSVISAPADTDSAVPAQWGRLLCAATVSCTEPALDLHPSSALLRKQAGALARG